MTAERLRMHGDGLPPVIDSIRTGHPVDTYPTCNAEQCDRLRLRQPQLTGRPRRMSLQENHAEEVKTNLVTKQSTIFCAILKSSHRRLENDRTRAAKFNFGRAPN
jgi:hypothetical protein